MGHAASARAQAALTKALPPCRSNTVPAHRSKKEARHVSMLEVYTQPRLDQRSERPGRRGGRPNSERLTDATT